MNKQKQTLVVVMVVMMVCLLPLAALAADGKTVTDPKGNLTVTNVVKETTFLFYEEECPVYWVPDTGTKVTYLGVTDAMGGDESSVLLHGWAVYGGEITDEGISFDVKTQLREDGTYNTEFWLNEDEQKYPQLYDDEHLTVIAYRDSRIYLGFVKSESAPATTPVPAPAPAPAPATALTATPTAATVLVNGRQIAFDAYNISGSNYFKLRDLATALNGSAKQFEVAFDSAANAISLTSGAPYTPVGGEMAAASSGQKTATSTSSKILLDGAEVSLTAYNIGGNNYFKLRDIGETFDFGVAWDNASSTISIDTSMGYTPE